MAQPVVVVVIVPRPHKCPKVRSKVSLPKTTSPPVAPVEFENSPPAGRHAIDPFTMQAGVSMTGLLFSMAMLAKGSSPSVFLPVMTSIIAYWLPAPSRD